MWLRTLDINPRTNRFVISCALLRPILTYLAGTSSRVAPNQLNLLNLVILCILAPRCIRMLLLLHDLLKNSRIVLLVLRTVEIVVVHVVGRLSSTWGGNCCWFALGT